MPVAGFSFSTACRSTIVSMNGVDIQPAVIAMPHRLDEPSVRHIAEALEAAAEASLVVLQGEPGRFCLGLNFAVLSASRIEMPDVCRGLEAFVGCLELLMRSPRPTLAVVDGPALGGGLGLAAACDIVLATERAEFGLPEALYGLTPAIIRPALLTRLSQQQL